MHSVSEAESVIFQHLAVFSTELVPLAEAGGRVLRAPICADRPLPPYDRSMMDGIALRASTAVAAISGGRALRVDATQFAGSAAAVLADPEGSCHRIMTGAVVPAGADCVLPVEWLSFGGGQGERNGERQGRGGEVLESILPPANVPEIVAGLFVHAMGSDRAAGELLVPAGTRLDGPKIAIAAAVGLAELEVAVRPRVALISTGDELVEPGLPILAHQIRPSSTFGLVAALRALGCEPVRMHLPDDPQALASGLREALAGCDAIVSSGGVSKGGRDFLPSVLTELGVTEHLHRVSQKPGRPMWFGTAQGGTAQGGADSGLSSGLVPVFALPGNPVSTLVCFRRFVQPALERALGLSTGFGNVGATAGTGGGISGFAVLAEPVVFRPSLTHFCTVTVEPSADGRLLATPVRVNTSGDFAALGASHGFVELPPEPSEFVAGTCLPFYAW